MWYHEIASSPDQIQARQGWGTEQGLLQPAAVQQDGVETHSQNKILAGKEAEQHRGKLEHWPSLWADRETEHQMGWSSLAET